MEPSALIKIIVILVGFFAIVVVMIILVAIGLWRRSKKQKGEASAYTAIASQTGWTFTAAVPLSIKPYLDLVDKQIFPNTLLWSTPAKNFLTTATQNGNFASFDYDHHISLGTGGDASGSAKWVYHKGVLLIADGLRHTSAFIVERRSGLGQAFQNFIGTGSASPLHENFSISGDDRIANVFSAPEIFSAMQSHHVTRIAGGANYLCVHFPRNENETPDAERIRYQFAFVQNLAERLKR